MEDEQPPPAPDFAVFQNSRTLTSAVWTKESGEWHQCRQEEYPAILILATLLRESSDPTGTMQQIVAIMKAGGGALPEDLPEDLSG